MDLKLLAWNIEGLEKKLKTYSYSSSEVKNIVYNSDIDIVVFEETWLKSELNVEHSLPGFKCFAKSWVKQSKYGRFPGGLAVFIKNNILNGINVITVNTKNISVFKLSGKYFSWSNDIILLCCYFPPTGSPTYENAESGMEILDNILNELKVTYVDVSFIILGDMNARVGNMQDYIFDDSAKYLPGGDWYEGDTFSLHSNTRDSDVVNEYGVPLINLCKMHDVHIVNGRTKSDNMGNYTYISGNGSSVIDYALL